MPPSTRLCLSDSGDVGAPMVDRGESSTVESTRHPVFKETFYFPYEGLNTVPATMTMASSNTFLSCDSGTYENQLFLLVKDMNSRRNPAVNPQRVGF